MMPKILTKKSRTTFELKSNSRSTKRVEMSTIRILMKLFVIRMVANSDLGLFRRSRTDSSAADFFFSSTAKSKGVKLKKATSAPDTKAEIIKRITKRTRYIKDPKGISRKIFRKSKGSGSGSNRNQFRSH